MAVSDTPTQYPDYLNPFGSSNDEQEADNNDRTNSSQLKKQSDDYPEYLSPFDADDSVACCAITTANDYDDSLNPFGDEDDAAVQSEPTTKAQPTSELNEIRPYDDDKNPFGEDDENEVKTPETSQREQQAIRIENGTTVAEDQAPKSMPTIIQPDSLEPPPKPLPRTKSLLKKEQALKRRQQQSTADGTKTISLSSTTSANSSSTLTNDNNPTTATSGSFQKRKSKRNAPPVPVNFKRQVSGSLDAIEEELNSIGDKLAIIERESILCQERLKSEADGMEKADFKTTRSKFIELIKRKNSIVHRQNELMYKKRELKLDLIHSDIEYELRMIGNKQLSHRTEEDETREKKLLKSLVDIVEEKNDIVENLNKESSCDNQAIEEELRRLNIKDLWPDEFDKKVAISSALKVAAKNENCDKSGLAKLSKIATLLPKSGTIKGTMKLKRKRLFKKNCDPCPIER